MAKQTISPTNKKVFNPHCVFKRKSVLFSSDDPEKLAAESSKVQLIREVITPDEIFSKCYEDEFSKFPDLESRYFLTSHEPERNQFFTTYPSRVGLRWDPCVDVSSGEEGATDWRPKRKKSSCNCKNCSSRSCPSKNSSGSARPVFKDNIMTFSDKCTMTLKLHHAGCSAKSPAVSPNVSNISVRSSRSQQNIISDYYSPQYSKPVFRKPCPRSDSYDGRPYYDEAVRDTDLSENYPVVRKAYARNCSSHNSSTQLEARGRGKLNLYNEGISDKVAERYPISSRQCPHKITSGGRTFCTNNCPNCRCRGPSARGHLGKESKYHQQCKGEYNGPLYYDNSTDSVHRVSAIPSFVPDRYTPIQRMSRAPSIILPKKVLTSERDIEEYIDSQHQCYRQSKRKKPK